jgi:protein-S-isoprenylcysteine O-methyltransferase Ste14
MALKGESRRPQSESQWFTSRAVTRVQQWATRLRLALAVAGATVLFVFVDRAPMWPGVLVALAGELVQLWASSHLRKNVDVVKSGPYAWLRNPMYVGRFFVGLGLTMLTWRWPLVLAYVVGFWLYAHARVVGEEVRLREMFGEEFGEYCRRVNRWLPLPPRDRLSQERGSWTAVLENRQLRVTAALAAALMLLKVRAVTWGTLAPWG